MEVELKYRIPDKETMEKIWDDGFVTEIEEKDSREDILMKAAYFDTEDRILSANDIAFRVRMEGKKIVASLKWNDKDVTISGLHMREEINIPVDDDACFIAPKADIFKESAEGRDLLEVIGDSPLVNIMEMVFVRRKLRLDDGDCICELSLDDGKIVCDKFEAPIREMEIELFSGEQEDLVKLGEKIAQEYDLEPEKDSKYARGLELIEENNC